MGFWGLEVKPGKPQAYDPKNEDGKLHLTQATLGAGLGKEKSVIQCSIGGKPPIYLCSLLPNKTECCPLNLEFDDEDEAVEFSVTGDKSIHLSGFLESYDEEPYEQDEDDSDGIDIGETESEESSDYDSEEDEDQMDEFEDFLDSNLEMYRQSSVPNSGVVIEEIEDEEKPAEDNKTKRSNKKKSQSSKDENAKKQIAIKESAHVPVLESEDEDGFPIPKDKTSEPEKMNSDVDEQGSNKKRKAKEQDGVQESANKNKKKKNQKEKKKGESASKEQADEQVETGNVLKKQETSQTQKAQNGTVNNAMTESSKTPDKSAEKKNKKKQKKNSSEEATVESKTISNSVEKPKSDSVERNQVNSKASQERTYPNGLVVEELSMGKPNGKKATPGKQVSVRYIGKLQKNGKIFDSNIGKAPFKFRLGVGQVIKGWDVGVNGMRVGDKRKLTIPPSMGYGAGGAGSQIPPNAWLTFDVELIDVK